jgi:hypothetical protein
VLIVVLIGPVNRASRLLLLVGALAPAVLTFTSASAGSGIGGPPVGFAHRAQTELVPTSGATLMGLSVAVAPGVAIEGSSAQTIGGATLAGAAQIYQTSGGLKETLKPIKTLTAPTPQSGAWYGESVATDGNLLVVGAPDTTADALGLAGVVYIYQRPTAGWQALSAPVATLTSPGPSSRGYFGESVAVEGDTVIVGAPGEDNDSGKVYVFSKPTTGWSASAPYIQLTADSGAGLGNSVAIDGDLIAAGAPDADIVHSDAGAIDLFVEPDGGWVSAGPSRELVESLPLEDQGLGASIGMYGRYVIGGAPAIFGSQPGRADVFKQPVGGWAGAGVLEQAAQLADSAAPNVTDFGSAVAIDSSEILVTAPQQTDSAKKNAGAVDVFGLPRKGYASTSTPSARVTGSSPQTNAHFGSSLADDGPQILVGAPETLAGGTTVAPRGAAYLFTTLAAPTLSKVSESKHSWAPGNKLPSLNPKHSVKGGTALRFTTNQAMPVTLSFAKRTHGHYGTAHELTVSAAKGKNVVYFGGRLSKSVKLVAGSYRVVLLAKNAAGDLSEGFTMHFTIK